VAWDDFEDYEKQRGRLREERRLLRILQQQAEETLAHELTLALRFASEGTLLSLKAPVLRSRVTPAVIVEKVEGPGQFPLLLCLTDENVWVLVPCGAVVALHAELSCLQVKEVEAPELHRSGELRHGDQASGGLALAVAHMARRHDMATPQYDLAGEVQAQAHLVHELELALELHPAHGAGDRKKLKKQRFRIEELEAEIEERQRILHFRANRHWETFLALIEILRFFGCLAGEEGLEPTEIGRTVAALRGDNELWLGLALMSGHLDELDPADLASVLEAISTEVNRPDLWSGFPPPPAAEEALHDLRGLRRELLRQQEQARPGHRGPAGVTMAAMPVPIATPPKPTISVAPKSRSRVTPRIISMPGAAMGCTKTPCRSASGAYSLLAAMMRSKAALAAAASLIFRATPPASVLCGISGD
jgi:superfamily II RNA helicase